MLLLFLLSLAWSADIIHVRVCVCVRVCFECCWRFILKTCEMRNDFSFSQISLVFVFVRKFCDVFFLLCAFFIIITIVVVVVTFAASDIFAGAFNSFLNKSNNVSASKFRGRRSFYTLAILSLFIVIVTALSNLKLVGNGLSSHWNFTVIFFKFLEIVTLNKLYHIHLFSI